jgi:membrane protease YdiL (CAAX protease family)
MIRLILALVLPTALVAVGLLGLRDVRATFLLYTLGGCLAGPYLLLGARPFGRGQGLPFRDRGWRPAVAQMLVIGVGLFAGYAVGRRWLADPAAVQARLAELGWDPSHLPVYAALFVLLIPLCEEWWWRGQALPRCVQALGPARGVVVSGLAFGAYHAIVLGTLYDVPSTLLRITTITTAGLFWSWWAWRRGNWAETFAGHLGASLAVVSAFTLFFL